MARGDQSHRRRTSSLALLVEAFSDEDAKELSGRPYSKTDTLFDVGETQDGA